MRTFSFSKTRGFAVAALVAAVVPTISPAAAYALESPLPTAQAKAMNATWVPYLDPPAKPAGICLVDTGVNVTPDTLDYPAGPIVERTALDGGSGEGGTEGSQLHGTYMAMTAAAAANGWGTVGAWPGVRIDSIRARAPGDSSFAYQHYQQAIGQCVLRAAKHNLVAVNLSLGCNCEPTPDERLYLENKIAQAHRSPGMSVVASAGNQGGALSAPANAPGVFSVGAGDLAGGLCEFSGRGDLDLVAPGCELDGADAISGAPFAMWSGGTSAAAIQASVVLALLRGYRPDLTWQSAEQLVADAARRSPEGPVLDLEATFRSARLGALVDAAREREALVGPNDAPTTVASAPSDPIAAVPGRADFGGLSVESGLTARTLPMPRIRRLTRRGRVMAISVESRPPHTNLEVTLQRRSGEFGWSRLRVFTRSANSLRLTITPRARRLRLRFVSAADGHGPALYRGLRK